MDAKLAIWVSDNPITYEMDGQRFVFDPEDFHSDATLSARGKPSVFYAMFSGDTFGTDDPGDWYHFYLQAAASYLGSTGEMTFDDPGFFSRGYGRLVDNAVDNATEQMRQAGIDDERYIGWYYANALSYLEGAKYGQNYAGTQEEILRESNLHRQGALFGLELAGVTPDEGLPWYVAALNPSPGLGPINLSADTYTILTPSGKPFPEPDNP